MKTYKKLMVMFAAGLWAVALTMAHAEAAQDANGRKFLPIRHSVGTSADANAKMGFFSLDKVSRNGRTTKMIPLNGARPNRVNVASLKDIAHTPRIAKRKTPTPEVALAKVKQGEDYLPKAPKLEEAEHIAFAPVPDAMPETQGGTGYAWPLAEDYHQISSKFGPRRHPITGERDFHAGIDLPAPKGTPVMAAAEGEVTGIGTHPRLGRYVKVTHEDGTYALYGHLQSWTTHQGARVKQGQRIGKVGSTGRSTGPHLDFSIRRDGKPIDPLPLLENTGEKILASAE
ncbi:MAG: M23 family metallopeptidase [Rickettsiales bacterium]